MKNKYLKLLIIFFLLVVAGLIVIASDIIVKQGDLTVNKLTANNIGIGTASSLVNLDVNGAIRAKELYPGVYDVTNHYSFIRFRNSTEYWGGFMHNDNNLAYGSPGGFVIYATSGRNLVLSASSGINLNGGNVGIGTNNPSDAKLILNVPNGINVVQKWKQADVERGAIFALSTEPNNFHIRSAGNLALDTANSNLPKLFIDNTGNVGIGTNAPLAKLDVNGNLKIGSIASKVGYGVCIKSGGVLGTCSTALSATGTCSCV